MNGRLAVGALLALVGGVGVAGVLFVQPVLDWPADPSRPLAGRPVVQLDGRVTGVDPGVLWVAPTVLGFHARRVAIDRNTRILVGAKEGGVGDVPVGARVVAIYEPGAGEPVARWIGINMDAETLRAAALRAAIDAAPPEPAVDRAPLTERARQPERAPQPERPPASAVRAPAMQAPSASPPPTRSATATAPARRADSPRPAVERRPSERTLPERAAPERSAPLTAPQRETDDPGAVIDWLLRGAGRN
jgi:hypothetical protein